MAATPSNGRKCLLCPQEQTSFRLVLNVRYVPEAEIYKAQSSGGSFQSTSAKLSALARLHREA